MKNRIKLVKDTDQTNINSIIENGTKSQKLDSDSIDGMDDEIFTPNSNFSITISSTKSHSSKKRFLQYRNHQLTVQV